ncbi:MAG: thiamine pyrophosphate-dependent enzyme, partial [Gammaproteobacteria bacterium]|nr:thiamine pyrophosphate-dependent enzyme [Gammaproteobacteria bacterium]
AVCEAAGGPIARPRRGDGPTLLECKTYRYYDHVGVRGMGLSYRTDEEVEQWRKKDPIDTFEARLAEQGILSTEAAQAVHDEVRAEVDAGIEFAEASPFPDPASITEDVYA